MILHDPIPIVLNHQDCYKNSYPKVHLEIGQVLRGGVRPCHAAERVQLWLIQQDLLNLIQIQVALVHLQDLRKHVKV